MYSTVSAKLLLVVVVAILLTGQMSYGDNGANNANNNDASKAKPNANGQAQDSPVDTPKKSNKPGVEEQGQSPDKEAAAPAPDVPAAAAPPAASAPPVNVAPAPEAVAPAPAPANVNANKFARGNLLNNQSEIPGTIQAGFYLFVAFGLVVIFYISYRSYRLRSSRAARRYGTRGNHSRHELQPLPSAIELESEDEENTVFDRISNTN